MRRGGARSEHELHGQQDGELARGTFLHGSLQVMVKAVTARAWGWGDFFGRGLTPKRGLARSR
jgi:hypothetical protein